MPIIKNIKRVDISPIKAKVNPQILERIEVYCQWAGIYDLGYFIEKAANELLTRDPEWILHQTNLEAMLEKVD